LGTEFGCKDTTFFHSCNRIRDFFFGFFYSVLFRLPLTVPSKASVPDTNTKLTSPEPVQLPLS